MIREDGTVEQMTACVVEACLPLPGEYWELKVELPRDQTVRRVVSIVEVKDGWVITDTEADSDMKVDNWFKCFREGLLQCVEFSS